MGLARKLAFLFSFLFALTLTTPALGQNADDGDGDDDPCPAGCYCVNTKVTCHPLKSGPLDWSSLPKNTIQLDLARYGLTELDPDSFAATPHLQKLDLQNNAIDYIEPGTFGHLQHLQQLDLSRNRLQAVTHDMFNGLVRLQRLRLNDNRIETVEEGAWDGLESLDKLELAENPLICDCNLAWFLYWLEKDGDGGRRLGGAAKTKCALPIALADVPLRKVRIEAFTCDAAGHQGMPTSGGTSGASLPRGPGQKEKKKRGRMSLFPERSQMVFLADEMRMRCKADGISLHQKISWFVRGKLLEAESNPNVTVARIRHDEEHSEESAVHVRYLTSLHSGEWTCRLTSKTDEQSVSSKSAEDISQSVNVFVVLPTTAFCPPVTTRTSRGTYTWSAAVGGYTVQQHCEKPLQSSFGFVYLLCRESGQWAANVNASQCAYTSQVTDTLQKFASMNVSFTESRALLESAKHLLNFTDHPAVFQDPMDLVFFSRAVENYLPYLRPDGLNLGHFMMSMIENVLDVGRDLLLRAQMRDLACRRLLDVVGNVTGLLPSFRHHTNKLAVEVYDMRPMSFGGVTCSWYSTSSDQKAAFQRYSPRRVLHCTQGNKTVPTYGKVLLASLIVPKSIYQHVNMIGRKKRDLMSMPLALSVYANASLFPDASYSPFSPVKAAVIGLGFPAHSRLNIENYGNLSESVTVIIRSDDDPMVEEEEEGAVVQPLWWDQEANGGMGTWNPNYCQLNHAKARLVWFSCNRIGFYTYRLLRNSHYHQPTGPNLFRFHHPFIYVGCVISIVLLVVSVVIYSLSFPSIRISRHLKHALVNSWSAMAALLFFYATGIYQTEHDLTCKAVGLVSHYLTLCNLIWLVISFNLILKKANNQKLHQSGQLNNASFLRPTGGRQSQPNTLSRSKEPLSQFYLLGWGVSALICCICAAMNLGNYGANGHCFMQLSPFLGAVILPGALLTALMVGFALSAWCVVMSSPARITEQIEVDVMASAPTTPRRRHRSSASASSSTRGQPDREKTTKSLLLAQAYIYISFLSTWMCGSLCVIRPLEGNLPYDELVFAILFAISSISLGVFVFVYFCASRQDVQECWRSPYCLADMDEDHLPAMPDGEGARVVGAGGPEVEETSNLVNLYPRQQLPNSQNSTYGGTSMANKGGNGLDKQQQQQHPHQMYMPQYDAGTIGYDANQQQQRAIYGEYGRNTNCHRRVKNVNLKKDSDMSSGGGVDRLSLDNVNHLRRNGCLAPVNSEAEHGIYGPPSSLLFGPSSSNKVNNLNIHVEPGTTSSEYSRLQPQPKRPPPKTSSPAGSAAPLMADQDIMVSPLTAQVGQANADDITRNDDQSTAVATRQEQQELPAQTMASRDISLDSVNPSLDYSESSTIKMGAPCQMASFAANDFAAGANNVTSLAPSSNNSPMPAVPPGFLSQSLPRKTLYERQKRHRYRTVPDNDNEQGVNGENGNAIAEENCDDDDARSKVSGVSSRSGASAGRSKRRQHKRPNRRRPRVQPMPNNQVVAEEAKRKNSSRNNNVRNLDDNYMGDDDFHDTLERRHVAKNEALEQVDELSESKASATSQFNTSGEMPTRETSV